MNYSVYMGYRLMYEVLVWNWVVQILVLKLKATGQLLQCPGWKSARCRDGLTDE
jgi:hypothetical protein